MKTPAKLRPVKVIVMLAAVCLTLLFCYNTLSSTLHSITRFKKSTEFNNLRQDPHSGILHEQKSMLSSKQRMRLRSIRDGEVTKKDIEIVVARYCEDLEWLTRSHYANLATIYDKSPVPLTIDRWRSSEAEVIEVPNVGRESNTYLTHTVKNYHNLANLTVFTQGQAPSRGYKGHRSGGGKTRADL